MARRRPSPHGRPTVLMVLPRSGKADRAGEGGITSAVRTWIAGGLQEHVDLELVPLAVWDAPIVTAIVQSAYGLLCLVSRFFLSARPPDVVHVHVSSGGSLYRKYLASRLAIKANIPVIVHLHSGGFEDWVRRSAMHYRVAQSLFGSAAAVVVVADRWRPLAAELGAATICTVPHMLKPDLAAALRAPCGTVQHIVHDQITLLFYGRWAPIKGLDVLAAAIQGLTPLEQKRIRLRLFGNGDVDWLRRC